jgi:hypothetical protein
MKNLSLLLALLLFILALVFFSCKKELNNDIIDNLDNTIVSKGSATGVDFTNTDPTWIQMYEPMLRPASVSTKYVPLGYTAGIPAPSFSGWATSNSDTIVVRWHIHVGLRYFNNQLKPDQVDYYYYNINARQVKKTNMPNRGAMGDYDVLDTVVLSPKGYYNSYNLGAGYDWSGISPTIHSSATNTILDSPIFVGVKQ